MRTNKILTIAALTVIAASVFGCSSGGNKKALTAHEWKLYEIRHADSTATVRIPENITISFSDTSMVYGHAGCNGFFGGYETKGQNGITFGQLGSTMMWCPEMPFEDSYHKLLRNVAVYRFENEELRLADDAGKFTLSYRRSEQQ